MHLLSGSNVGSLREPDHNRFLATAAVNVSMPFEDLGPGSTDCHLEGTGALAAAAAVRKDIAAGCDLVILSKFGKMEAAGKGLVGAFEAAIDADVPLLTSVSPVLEEAWRSFVSTPFAVVSGDAEEIRRWWQIVQSGRDGNVGNALASSDSRQS